MLYRNIKSPSDYQILQDDLNSLSQWETDWQMKFDVAKCHSMRVTRHLPDKHILFDYTFHQQKLEQVQCAKYLGITITDNLDWGLIVFPPAPKKGMVRFSKKGTFSARRHAMRALLRARDMLRGTLNQFIYIYMYLQSKSLIVITVLFMLPADLYAGTPIFL